MKMLMDVEQYHLVQKDVLSSLHEKLTKGEKIVRGSSTIPISGF